MKNVAKSIRMTEEVFEAIDGYQGEGFNNKLENLVLDYIKGKARMQRERDLLKDQIADKLYELRQIQDRVRHARDVERRLGPLLEALTDLLRPS